MEENAGKTKITSYSKIRYKPHNTYGFRETKAALSVVRSGQLSKFLGTNHADFFGGKKVQEFEKNWKEYFNVNNAISVNSATSGLIAAIGAIGIEPGDEVITTPWTMSASASSILHWSGIPIFADIDPKTFCISPASIEKRISEKTKAIIAVDIFGQSCDLKAIMQIAKKHGLKVISDTSQAPGAISDNNYAGTIADIGVYSLNYHKHIHTGEGGMIVTNDSLLAQKMRLIRNHAEAVVETNDPKGLANMVGFNFRMGEVEAAIGIEQLKKLEKIVMIRQQIVDELNSILNQVEGIETPYVPQYNSHVYYIYPMIIKKNSFIVDKFEIANQLTAAGLKGISTTYQNLHMLPIFQNQIALGSSGYPWLLSNRKIDYSKGICPVAEEFQDVSYMGFYLGAYNLNLKNANKIARRIADVLKHLRSK